MTNLPLCRKCGKTFPNRIKIEGLTRVLSNRKFCLACSPFNSHNTRDITKPKTPESKRCARCKVVKKQIEFHRRGKNRTNHLQPNCKPCNSKLKTESKQELKLWAVAYKGGSCQICGYNKYASVLEFHHRDPKKKDFKIANLSRFKSEQNKEKLRIELDKCDLLCSNCHRETHAKIRGDRTLQKLTKSIAKRKNLGDSLS